MMDFPTRIRKRISWQLVALSLCLLLVPLIMNSCSTTNYDIPITSQTSATATLIEPETLKSWIDNGFVNGTGLDRVVILDVTSQATYSAGHIPGAQYANSAEINQSRQEGPAVDINMNADGPHMDAFIQKYGIDKNTTIVFTTGGTPGASTILSATRAYWIFRYWGFPKERLKLLNGVNFSYAATYPGELTTVATPAPVPSTYSVRNNASLRTDLRASLLDMINVAENRVPNAVPIDMRTAATAGSYAGFRGSTSGVFNPGSDFTVFEGRITGARAMDYTTLFDSTNNYRFKSPDVLASMFNGVGIDGTKYTHTY